MLERLFALETFGIKLGLENITKLCRELGHPERSFTSLHVAGTNGKGSVAAMTHAALVAAGLRASRYTSPHLTELAERFVLGRHQVEGAPLATVVEKVLATADRMRADGSLSALPTFFEATTAVAFELFRLARTEVGVIEVGLGGRFDATNVIQPVAGAITTIGFDHQQHLGHTLQAIAFEKAGIIKPGVSVVIGALPPEAAAVVRHAAAERDARLIEAATDTRVEAEIVDGHARVTLTTPHASYGPVRLSLRGEHQVMNAVVATRLLEAAAEQGVSISKEAIEEGLESAEWPARLELCPLENGRHVLLDAAHNAQGAQALASYLRRWHPNRPPLVVSIMRDKDVSDIMTALIPEVSTIVATEAPTPRALAADRLAQRAREAGAVEVIVEVDPMRALDKAFRVADTVCVAGSIFLVGPVRAALTRRAILP